MTTKALPRIPTGEPDVIESGPVVPPALITLLSSAWFWLGVSVACGMAATVTGVYLLAGVGWALLAVGAFCFGAAWLIRLGIANG